MSDHVHFDDIIYFVSDITAVVFLIMLIISISVQTEKRSEPGRLLAAAILMLAGLNARLLAGTIEILPEDFVWRPAAHIPTVPADLLWIMSFLLTTFGIMESATYVIYANGGRSRSSLKIRFVTSIIIFAVGTVIYTYTGSINALAAGTLAQFAS